MIFSSRTSLTRSIISRLPSKHRTRSTVSSSFQALSHSFFSPQPQEEHATARSPSAFQLIVSRVRVGDNEDEALQSLLQDRACNEVHVSHALVRELLDRLRDDWKSAMGVFRWAESRVAFDHAPEAYDAIVDILGKSRRMEKMREILAEMNGKKLVGLVTVGKAMRRLSGAGLWEDAVKLFDEISAFGLEKNTESMNMLLDTLCKERRVEQARAIMLQLKPHILPDAYTFNILIHGWCKINRVDEARWTIQEMKGHGVRPSVITYSTISHFYCRQWNFTKVYELFDEMRAQGCPPNVITYTTVIHCLAKSEDFDEALQLAERVKSDRCELDANFYSCLINVFSRARRVGDAIRVFEMEMPESGVKPSLSIYNTMIAMFCHCNRLHEAFHLLEDMEASDSVKPDLQTYYPLLKYCFKAGAVDGLLSKLLDDMVSKYHLSLDISAYKLLIHGLCRADRTHWAYLLFEEMISQDITPTYQTCRLLLEEVKQKNMYDAADRIVGIMKRL